MLVAHIDLELADSTSRKLKFALSTEDIDTVICCLKVLFAHIPYQLHIEQEPFYHGLLQMAFYASGINATSEYCTSHARIDLVLDLPDKVYVCEVKFNEPVEKALKQIENRRYYEPFLSCGKPIILLGISFFREPGDFRITYLKKRL